MNQVIISLSGGIAESLADTFNSLEKIVVSNNQYSVALHEKDGRIEMQDDKYKVAIRKRDDRFLSYSGCKNLRKQQTFKLSKKTGSNSSG